jgi:hypothetical protein
MDDDSGIQIQKLASQDSSSIAVPHQAFYRKPIESYDDFHGKGLLASGRVPSNHSNSEVISSSNNNSAPENVNERSVAPTHRMKTSDIDTIKQVASGL